MKKRDGVDWALLMAPTSMRANIQKIGLMGTEDSYGLMAGITKDILSTTCTAVKELSIRPMEPKSKDFGIIGSTWEAKNHSQISSVELLELNSFTFFTHQK